MLILSRRSYKSDDIRIFYESYSEIYFQGKSKKMDPDIERIKTIKFMLLQQNYYTGNGQHKNVICQI